MRLVSSYRYYRDLYVRHRRAMEACRSYDMKLYNWFDVREQDLWLPMFVRHRGLMDGRRVSSLGLFTIAGPRGLMRLNRSERKIFLCRENLHRVNHRDWSDMCLEERCVDLVIGYDYLEHPRYIRVPLWVMWAFSPFDSIESIRKRIAAINSPANHSYDDRRFCSFLCSHDDIGRRELYDAVSGVGRVDCDGKLFHNNDDLVGRYNNVKVDYLRQYRFNLTPENSDERGYCTEKLFEAMMAGCVPIYKGCLNDPEPDVVDRKAIIMIGNDYDNVAERVAMLNNSRSRYLEFANQPIIKPGAEEVIAGYMDRLEQRIKEII